MNRIYLTTAKILCAFALIAVFEKVIFAQAPKWYENLQQIKVTETNRVDVERLFGDPPVTQVRTGKWNQIINYELEIGKLEVSYSTGKCSSQSNTDGYDLDKNKVIRLSLLLYKPVKISKLKLRIDGFRQFEAVDTNVTTYTDDENGIKYIGNKERIRSLIYSVGDRLFNSFDCTQKMKDSGS